MSNSLESSILIKQKAKIESLLEANRIMIEDFELLLLAYKKERTLKVFAKNIRDNHWINLIDYDFCTFSGTLGPKIKEGDKQIPEGFYQVDRFNPKSNFHLSLGLNYPTERDMKIADKEQPGSDIFIHGGCRSVGCIAITDEKIEELYTIAKMTSVAINVIILPFEMNKETINENVLSFPDLKLFWNKLYEDLLEKKLVLN